MSKLSDKELLNLYKDSGKNIYFRELFNRYLPLIYGVCLKYLKSNDNAQNAVMQLYENLLNRITDYEIDVFQPWIYSIVKNHCLQILRNEEPYIKVDLLDNINENDEIHMILQDYLSENNEKEFYQPEQETIRYPFLQDAIEGYDQVNDQSTTYGLKIVKQHIKKRKRKNYYYLQLISIVTCIVVFILLSIFFFVHDSYNENDIPINTTYIDNRVDNADKAISADKAINADKAISAGKTINAGNPYQVDIKKEDIISLTNQQKDFFEKKEELAVRQEIILKYEEDIKKYLGNQQFDDRNGATLSNSEIQAVLSEYKKKELPNINIPIQDSDSKLLTGEKAFNNYINNNLKKLSDNTCGVQHGKVELLFKVNENGRPYEITVLRSICQAIDIEAIKLLQNGPDWSVSNNHVRVDISF